MAFILHSSTRLERLIDQELASLLDKAPADPFIPERIIVQSQGMSAYLKKELTRIRGLTCNLDLPFLNNFVNEVLEETLDEPPATEYFQPEILCWPIYAILRNIASKYDILKNYIAGQNRDLKRFQLACKIADVFDNYQIYRPHLLLRWQGGKIKEDEKWQAEIWCQLIKNHISRTVGFWKFITTDEIEYKSELDHISVFGISTMAPIYLSFFKKLSHYIDVHFFTACYCGSEKYQKLAKVQSEWKSIYGFNLENKVYHQNKNQFLSSNNITGKEFDLLLKNKADRAINNLIPVESGSMLNNVQKAFVNDKKQIDLEYDDTLQIHKVHSKMREVEVLYNNLLRILDKRNSIRPQDITVIIPELEEYIPYIIAVFSRYSEGDKKHIPYRIADISAISFNKFVDTFINILNVGNSRFKAGYLLKILENELVRAAFDFVEDDLDLISKWIRESGIRWGIDEDDHERFGNSKFRENSWQFGLNRLLLGYSINNDNDQLYKTILPYDKIEGQDSEILGNMYRYVHAMMEIDKKFQKNYDLREWREIIIDVIDRFFKSNNKNYDYVFQLKNTIENLFEHIDGHQNSTRIGIDTIRYYLKENITARNSNRGYFRGEITIGSAQHLNGIPAKVICLLGLNEGTFPRIDSRLSFDIYQNQDWLGDRSKRNEDRYLFLSSLMSARECFYVSYVGYDKNNEALPPSSVISDLIDILKEDHSYDLEFENNLHVSHKLHGFSPAYFTSRNWLFSYFEDDFTAASALQNQSSSREFYSPDMDFPSLQKNVKSEITVNELEKFFKNPAKFFTQHRLNIKFPSNYENDIKDREPVDIDVLEGYHLDTRIQKAILQEKDRNEEYKILKAEGRLPVQSRSRMAFNEHYESVKSNLEEEYKYIRKTPYQYLKNCNPKFVKIKMESYIIRGELGSVYNNRINIFYRPAKYKGKYAIKMWLNHLILSLAEKKEVQTLGFYKKKGSEPVCYRIKPLDKNKARSLLDNLVKIYLTGLERPLAFFPNTSFRKFQGRSVKTRWVGQQYRNNTSTGEYENDYVQLYFDKDIVKQERFERLAEKVFSEFDVYWEEVKNAN